jgi:hypothetical protein
MPNATVRYSLELISRIVRQLRPVALLQKQNILALKAPIKNLEAEAKIGKN